MSGNKSNNTSQTNQAGQPLTKTARQKMTDAQELYALLGQVADLADHARRGIDLAGLHLVDSTVQELLVHARDISRFMKKQGELK